MSIVNPDEYTRINTGWPTEDYHFIEPPGHMLVTQIVSEETGELQGIGIQRYADDEENRDSWRASICLTKEQAQQVIIAMKFHLGISG